MLRKDCFGHKLSIEQNYAYYGPNTIRAIYSKDELGSGESDAFVKEASELFTLRNDILSIIFLHYSVLLSL